MTYTLRIIVSYTTLDSKRSCNVRHDFLPYVKRAKETWDLLKERSGFPRLDKYQEELEGGPNSIMKQEILNFSQFFPKFVFSILLSYHNNTNLYLLEVQSREILSEKFFIHEPITMFTGILFVPRYNIDTILIEDEITDLLK